MFSWGLPLRAILFQLLFLLIAIATEAATLRHRLGLSRKTSMEYATALNLFSTTIGWLLFLLIEPWLPGDLRRQVISYLLFNDFYANGLLPALPTLMVLTALVTFLLTIALELQGLGLLERILEKKTGELEGIPETVMRRDPSMRQAISQFRNRRMAAILYANAVSYSVMTAVLFLRVFEHPVA